MSERLGQFGLKLHPDKTRLIEFGRFARDNRRRRGQGKPQTFDFLGFTHCCGHDEEGSASWSCGSRVPNACDPNSRRSRSNSDGACTDPIAEQGQYLRAVVAGHGRYFGVPDNGARLRTFRFQVAGLWHRTLCRRSQSRGLTWRRMYRLMAHWLPVPNICHPYPNQRLIVTTQGRSRMR